MAFCCRSFLNQGARNHILLSTEQQEEGEDSIFIIDGGSPLHRPIGDKVFLTDPTHSFLAPVLTATFKCTQVLLQS